MSWFETALIRNKFYPIIIPKQSGDYTSTDIKILDADQEQVAFDIGEGHRVIRGVAGSGKTVILIARAKYLAATGKQRILILCYNRLLSQFMNSCTKEFPNIEVRTFASWSAKNGVLFNKSGPRDDAQGTALRERFEASIAPDAGQFDSVLVDEAQLMSRDWLICARLALRERDPAKASLFIVADGSQSLRKMLRFTWKEAGIIVSPGAEAGFLRSTIGTRKRFSSPPARWLPPLMKQKRREAGRSDRSTSRQMYETGKATRADRVG